jgi:ABC-type protease/lipase transport system fused ATPase/permease subunit
LRFQPTEPRPAAAPPAPRGFGRLEVEDVTFAYPGTARPAVDGVSLEIGAGEVIALVGENGSGKTTLAKIVAGLYPPQRGRVLWDGVDATRYDPDDLRRSVAVIFQDFERYLLPARENVGLGRHERIDDAEAIAAAARRADADGFLSRLPEAYDTMLGREFAGGWDLSIGQWQRVALARAFFRDAPLVILDEPTAALARGPRAVCSSACASCSRDGRSSSSRTASRAFARPTGSTCSAAGGSSSTAHTTSCSQRTGSTPSSSRSRRAHTSAARRRHGGGRSRRAGTDLLTPPS